MTRPRPILVAGVASVAVAVAAAGLSGASVREVRSAAPVAQVRQETVDEAAVEAYATNVSDQASAMTSAIDDASRASGDVRQGIDDCSATVDDLGREVSRRQEQAAERAREQAAAEDRARADEAAKAQAEADAKADAAAEEADDARRQSSQQTTGSRTSAQTTSTTSRRNTRTTSAGPSSARTESDDFPDAPASDAWDIDPAYRRAMERKAKAHEADTDTDWCITFDCDLCRCCAVHRGSDGQWHFVRGWDCDVGPIQPDGRSQSMNWNHLTKVVTKWQDSGNGMDVNPWKMSMSTIQTDFGWHGTWGTLEDNRAAAGGTAYNTGGGMVVNNGPAKWMYDTCPIGTEVVVFDSVEPKG